MRTDFSLGSASRRKTFSGAALGASLAWAIAIGASSPALAGCGAPSSYQYTGVHGAASGYGGIHSAASAPSAGSVGTPGMSSCPSMTNATKLGAMHRSGVRGAGIHAMTAQNLSGVHHTISTTSVKTTNVHTATATKTAKVVRH